MTVIRDTQRSKVYAAERPIHQPKGTPPMTIDECQALVDKILASRYVARRYDDTMRHITMRGGIHVRPGRNGGHATVDYAPGGYFGAVIGLGLWARQPVVVIHEVAHHLTGLWHQHDHHFAATMLDLTRHFMGADPAATLAASYKEHGVRTRPKATRTMTPQQRAAATARLAANRRATGPAIPTFLAGDLYDSHECVTCHRLRHVIRFPTSKVPGVREERCRECRDAIRWQAKHGVAS